MKKAAHTKATKATKATKGLRPVGGIIAEIREQLEAIESHLVWLIRADHRFSKGLRVEFSRRALRNGIALRRHSGKGVVMSVDGFSVVVQLDGQKQKRSYHHALFNPISGPKLF